MYMYLLTEWKGRQPNMYAKNCVQSSYGYSYEKINKRVSDLNVIRCRALYYNYTYCSQLVDLSLLDTILVGLVGLLPDSCRTLAGLLPGPRRALAVPLPDLCQTLAVPLSDPCRTLARLLPGSYQALAGLLPGSCQALAGLLPGSCHALARLLPGSCHALAGPFFH